MNSVAWRGWSDKGSSEYSRHYSPRQGCRWTDKEDYDLMQQMEYGVPIEWIADFHQRSLGGISSRLLHPDRAEAGAARHLSGEPKPAPIRYTDWGSSKMRLKYLKKRTHKEQHHGST